MYDEGYNRRMLVRHVPNMVNQQHRVGFSDFPAGHEYFFDAPEKFKGNKLAAYGGNLTFTISYEGSNEGERPRQLEVKLTGRGLTLVHRQPSGVINEEQLVRVVLSEASFRRGGERVSREEFLMVLAGLEEVRIRASFLNRNQLEALLGGVSMDFGQDVYAAEMADRMARVKATAVEICQCPVGYSGYSCEVSSKEIMMDR